jgi:hypothetical protein
VDTTVIGVIFIAGVAALIVFLLTRGLRGRSEAMRVLRGPLAGGDLEARRPGSAAEIADAGQIPVRELMGALRVAEVPELDSEGEPNEMAGLGLRLHDTGSDSGSPQVSEGTRNGHQVFVRHSAAGGGLPRFGISYAKFRTATVVRVQAPDFTLESKGGVLVAGAGAPAEVAEVIGSLTPSPDVWHDVRVQGGADGIAASRPLVGDWLSGWVYDLWLGERIAARLGAKPLSDVRLTRDWAVPYGL